MKYCLAFVIAFACGFGLCWFLFVRGTPSGPSPDRVEGLTVIEPKRPDSNRRPVFLKVVHVIDASRPGDFPEPYGRRNDFWQVHLTAGERTIILLADPIALPIAPAD
jgi:hypothetical protein